MSVLPVPEADEIAALCFSASEYGSYTARGPEDWLAGLPPALDPAGGYLQGLGVGLRRW